MIVGFFDIEQSGLPETSKLKIEFVDALSYPLSVYRIVFFFSSGFTGQIQAHEPSALRPRVRIEKNLPASSSKSDRLGNL